MRSNGQTVKRSKGYDDITKGLRHEDIRSFRRNQGSQVSHNNFHKMVREWNGNGTGMERVLSRIGPRKARERQGKAWERPDASSVRNDAGNDAENDAENDTLHTMPEVRTIPPVGYCCKYTAKMKNVLQK